ncbi:MAG: SDR family oxidoreductase [Rhodoferax sp.]|nr:SDR family oxidoreductase [Rhodoferax sp.]
MDTGPSPAANPTRTPTDTAASPWQRALDFTGRRVLVVGGSSGIGNGIAVAFRTQGAAVEVWGTRPSADHYAGDAGSDLEGMMYRQVDVSRPQQVLHQVRPERLDVLVLSQGTVAYGQREFDPEVFQSVVDLNLNSLMRCAAHFRDSLAACGGALITISSVGGIRATQGNPAYAASKAGAIHLTRTLGQAWARDGIRVNGVAPGLVETKLTRVTVDNPQRLAARLKGIPMGRLGTPADMAGACLFLASPLSAYLQGQTLFVDGGRSL